MSLTYIFTLLGGLVVLAFVANRLSGRTRVPDIIVLIATGILIGPVLGLIKASQFQQLTNGLGTLALMLILFEGGLDLEIRSTLRILPGSVLLSFLAYAFSFVIVAEVTRWTMGLSWPACFATGAALGCTSGSVTLPVMQQIKVSSPVRTTLMIESAMSDCFAVLTVGILLNLSSHGGPIAAQFTYKLLFMVVISLLLAISFGILWSYLLPKLSERRFWNAMTLAAVLLLYAAAERVGASGLVTVFCFGIVMANIRRMDVGVLEESLGLRTVDEEHHTQMLTFYSELAFLVRTFFFVLLGVLVQLRDVITYLLPAVGILGALLLARALAIKASSWTWKDFQSKERELVLWIMPRGLITIVLALQVVRAWGNDFEFLPVLAFAIIIVTNIMLVIGSIRAMQVSPAPDALAESPSETSEVRAK